MQKDTTMPLGISRRSFLALSGAIGAGAMLTGCSPKQAPKADTKPKHTGMAETFDYDKVVWGGCHVNCGSRCPLRLYVKDDTVVRVGIDDTTGDDFGPGKIYQMRSCVRGRTNRQRIYNETRIQKPLKRVEGTKRGEGKYEEISWDQAIDEIAEIMKGIKEEYGNDAFYIQYGTGQIGGTVSKSWHPDATAFARLMNCWGGYLRQYCDYSTGQIDLELSLFNGNSYANNEVTDWVNSKNIVMFGNNPANTRMSGSAMMYLITEVRLQNPDANIIVVDPHLTDTAIGVANKWIPIRPGTDPALVAGMIYYLLTSGKLNEEHIRNKFVGFYSDSFFEDIKAAEPQTEADLGLDKTGTLTPSEDMSYEAYLMGTGAYAGTGEKTPEWAASITGVPADEIRALADVYLDGPTATTQGWGPQRHTNGGNSARAIALIATITGNAGISGGGTGAREGVGGVGFPVPGSIPNFGDKNTVKPVISFFEWFHAIEDYKSMRDDTWGLRQVNDKGQTVFASEPGEITLKAPIKFIWNYASNVMMGQHADINDCLRIYNLPDEKDSGLRCVVTCDVYMTPTAMISDYILPGTTSYEEMDITKGGSAWTGFVLCESPAISPMFECKPVYEICTLLADKLGVKDEFTEGRDQEGWVKWLFEQGQAKEQKNKEEKGIEPGLPATFEEFKAGGLFKQTNEHTPSVAKDDKIGTPSGKYEVFSKQLYNISQQWDLTAAGYVPADGLDQITPCPIWYNGFESFGDEETKKEYPFQLIGHHTKTRTHSSYGNVDWMKSVAPQQCWISTYDAKNLGIENGDEVRISTRRGTCQLSAKVTDRMMPGVASIPQGAWYKPETQAADKLGNKSVVDFGGCISTLTSQRPTAISKGNGVHTNLCKIEKA